MAATEKIVDIIQEKAFKDLERLNNALTISYNKFNDNIGAAIKFNNALGGSKSLKDFTVQATNAEKALEKVAKEQAKAAAVEQKAAQVREKAALAAEKAAARQSKQITEQSRLYTQLSNTLEKLRKDAQDVGVRFGENSMQFQKASEKVIALDSKLKAIDATLGKSQRNVGNYSGALGGFRSGFNGLSNSVNQLTREFPAFTFSVQTGFLALSNNIPIFMDQIRQTQMEIKAMRAEGQKVPGLFKQLASSILSFGTIMSIGITLLTVFGKEIGNFIGAMFQGKDALDQFTVSQREYREVRQKSEQDAQKEIVTLDTLYRASQNQNLSLSDRKKAVDELQRQYPKYFANLSDEEILAGRVGNAYRDLKSAILATALARASEDKIAENSSKRLDNEINIRIKERAAKRLKIELDLAKEINAASGSGTGPGGGAGNIATQSKVFAIQKEINKNLSEAEALKKNNLVLDSQSLKIATDIDKLIEKNGINTIIPDSANPSGGGEKRSKARVEKEKDTTKELLAEYEHLYNEQIRLAKAADALLLSNLRTSMAERQSSLSIAADEEMVSLARQFASGEIKQDEYSKKRLYIQRNLSTDLINEDIRGVEAIINLQKEAGQDTSQGEKELSDLKKRLSKETTDAQIADLEKLAEKEQEIKNKRKELEQEVAQLAISIVEGQFERQNQRFETEAEQVDIKKARDIEAAEKSVGTEEEKAARIALIEARAQGQREAIERKQRQLALEKARFDRLANIANVIQYTATAVAQALPNIPLSILVGAIGAAQIAQVLASPIPKYKDGVNSSNEGPAWVGDGYKHELQIDPDGKMSITPDTPTLTYLKKGTKIIGGNEFQKMLTAPEKINYIGGQAIDINALIAESKNSTKQLKEALSHRPDKTPVITEGGMKYINKTGSRWNNYSSRNIN